MRKIIIFSISCILLISACKEIKKEEAVTEEAVLPIEKEEAISLYEDLEGNPIALADYQGKGLVVNFWATWCKPCIEEMPAMARAEKALANDNYVFLFASDQSVEKIIAFKEQRQFGLEFIKYNGAYADLQITALPVTLIFNAAGEQVERIEGGMNWDTPVMISKLKQLQ